jgi:hypothetical protein
MALFGEREQAIVALSRPRGDPFHLVIDRHLFEDQRGRWKITKGERQRYLPLLAECILAPDEGWVLADKLYLLARFALSRGAMASALAVFLRDREIWSGVTGYVVLREEAYLAHKRAKLARDGRLEIQR